MNLSAIRPRKSGTEAQAATETARRNAGASNGNLLFRDTRPVIEAVAKGLQKAAPVKPGVDLGLSTLPAGPAASGDLSAVLKAMTDGFAKAAAAIRGPAQKAAPAPEPAAAPATALVAHNTPLVSAQKRARTAEIAGQVQKAPNRAAPALSASGNAPFLPPETEGQRRRSRDDAVAAQRAAEKTATDRVLVSKGGSRALTLKALDLSLSSNALVVLTHIIGRWQEAGRRPVRVRASDTSDATGLTTAQAQAALDELEAARATIVAINSVGTRLVMPGLGVVGE